MTEPIRIGGVNIYGNYKILPKEGDLNVIEYNGITIKFPDQKENIKNGKSSRPPFISTGNDGRTEVCLKNAEVFGSEKDDTIEAWCIGSIFRFKEGGSDTIINHIYQDGNYKGENKQNSLYLDKSDMSIEYITLYEDNNAMKRALGLFTRKNGPIDGELQVITEYEPYDNVDENEYDSANQFEDNYYDE